jgi:hypothetical protein
VRLCEVAAAATATATAIHPLLWIGAFGT